VLAALDWVLTVLHVGVVLAFVFLWIPRRTARLHGWLVALVSFSWIVIGYFKGFGYCVLTDLQWRVKHARGQTHLPGSFLKYMADRVSGTDVPSSLINDVAAVVFFVGVGAALVRYFQARSGRLNAG
jgi:hypothetical protein